MDCSMPGSPVLHYLPEFAQIHVHWVSDAICYVILCYFLLLLPSVFPSIKVFLMSQLFPSGGWSIGASALASVLSVNIQDWFSFGVDWFDLLAVQGTLKSLIQHHSLKVSILRHSAFFMVQLSHPYMTTGKTTALTIQTFVGKVKSLLFNILSRFFITSLPRSECLLILWPQSPSAVILEPRK